MSKRAEVEAMGYHIDNEGRIVSPGKFEAEHWSTVILWDTAIQGFADETYYDTDDTPIDVIALTDEDRDNLELPDYQGDSGMETITHVLLWENESGFVQSKWLTQDQYDEFIEEVEFED